jgi:hypothetical protein
VTEYPGDFTGSERIVGGYVQLAIQGRPVRRTGHEQHVGVRIRRGFAGCPPNRRPSFVAAVRPVATDHDVVAGIARQLVAIRAAAEAVIAGSANERVHAIAAKVVIFLLAKQPVSAAGTDENVVANAPAHRVVRPRLVRSFPSRATITYPRCPADGRRRPSRRSPAGLRRIAP